MYDVPPEPLTHRHMLPGPLPHRHMLPVAHSQVLGRNLLSGPCDGGTAHNSHSATVPQEHNQWIGLHARLC